MLRVNKAAKGEIFPREDKVIQRHRRRNVEIPTFNKFTFFRGGRTSSKIGMETPKNRQKDTKQGVYLGVWWEMPNFYKNVSAGARCVERNERNDYADKIHHYGYFSSCRCRKNNFI